MSQWIPKHYDVLLEISSSAIEHLVEAKTEDDAWELLGQLVHHPTPQKYARMKIEVKPTGKGRIDFYWEGFFFGQGVWAL